MESVMISISSALTVACLLFTVRAKDTKISTKGKIRSFDKVANQKTSHGKSQADKLKKLNLNTKFLNANNVEGTDIYGSTEYAYYSGEYFDEILPECYYPTPTTYLDLEYCYSHQTEVTPAPCVSEDDLVFNNVTGSFSADQTFYNCMANIPDVASMPTFFNGKYHGCLMISTQVTLLNLVRVDEVEGVAELQIIIDFVWTDRRYNMPLFWDNVPFFYSGFDVTTILTNQSTVLWRPAIVFPDAQSVEIMSETMSLASLDNSTLFLYEVTYDLLLVQPGFDFRRYPNDAQNLIIRFSALNYDAQQLQLLPNDIACSYLPDKTCSFSNNAIWIWKDEPSFQGCTAYPDQKASLIYPAYAYYSVKIVRQGNGIIVRLVLPLTLLLLISALTFWVSYENRVDTTITLLLSVSALYIIILQSIPLVGYLTDIDKFVFWMFLLLCVVVAMHQMYATLFEKIDTWPLRILYLRLIEMCGRCFVPPAIIFYFMGTIEFGSQPLRNAMISIVVISISILFVREVYGIRSAYYHAIELVVEKFNKPELTSKEVSGPEIFVLNRYFFKKSSFDLDDIARELSVKGFLHFEKPTSIMLKNMSSLAKVMTGSNAAGDKKKKHPDPLFRQRWFSGGSSGSEDGDMQGTNEYRLDQLNGQHETVVEMSSLPGHRGQDLTNMQSQGRPPMTADAFRVSYSTRSEEHPNDTTAIPVASTSFNISPSPSPRTSTAPSSSGVVPANNHNDAHQSTNPMHAARPSDPLSTFRMSSAYNNSSRHSMNIDSDDENDV